MLTWGNRVLQLVSFILVGVYLIWTLRSEAPTWLLMIGVLSVVASAVTQTLVLQAANHRPAD